MTGYTLAELYGIRTAMADRIGSMLRGVDVPPDSEDINQIYDDVVMPLFDVYEHAYRMIAEFPPQK